MLTTTTAAVAADQLTTTAAALTTFIRNCETYYCEYAAARPSETFAELAAIARISSQRSANSVDRQLTSALADRLYAAAVKLADDAAITYRDMVVRIDDIGGIYFDVMQHYTDSASQLRTALHQLTVSCNAVTAAADDRYFRRTVKQTVNTLADVVSAVTTLIAYDATMLYYAGRLIDDAARGLLHAAAVAKIADDAQTADVALTTALQAGRLARLAIAADAEYRKLTAD